MQSKLKVKLLEHTPNIEKVIASSAKLCYSPVGVDGIQENLTEENISKFVNMLVNIGHESPLEHCTFTFAIEGVSRVLTHQLVRHRLASYSQQSQRYVKLEQFEYIIPPEIENNKKAKEIFIKTMENDQKAYNDIVQELLYGKIYDYWSCEGVPHEELMKSFKKDLIHDYKVNNPKGYTKFEKQAIEDARYVFPNACETKIVVTMNIRSLMNFFAHRCCERAQWEIRELAFQMRKLCREVSPSIFKNAGASCLQLGYCKEGNLSCGRFITKKELLDKANEQGLRVYNK